MRQTLIYSFLALLLFQLGIAQNIKGKIIDSKTQESIPYATIKVNESENLVSNAEGYFTLSERNSREETLLTITYLGYVNQQLTVSDLLKSNFIVALAPGIFELSDVSVSNEKPNPYEIMANVKANLANNYKNDGAVSKDLLFYRRTENFKPKIMEVEIGKSTGFTKQALQKVNTDVKSFSSQLISHPMQEFTDILCNYYTTTTIKDKKAIINSKLNVLKATKLKNEGSGISSDELQQTIMNTVLQHLDSTKYYRVKSGLFGSRDTISLRKDFNRKKDKSLGKSKQLTATKNNIESFISANSFLDSFNFISKPDQYDYRYEGTTYTTENEFAYVLTFKPRKSKAKYIGKLYVSETDYAVLRAEYTLDEGENLNNFNMKFLLGIKASQTISKGTVIYKKKLNENSYYIQYATQEKGQYFYINRPVKFIELTREEKDILALDLKIEANSITKIEFLNMSHSATTSKTLESIKETNFKYTTIKSYDPKIWREYNAIEPLEEMKRFKAMN